MSTISSDVLQLPPTLQLQNYVDSSISLYLYFFASILFKTKLHKAHTENKRQKWVKENSWIKGSI